MSFNSIKPVTGNSLTMDEIAVFNMVYSLAVMQQLVLDKLLYCPNMIMLKPAGFDTLNNLSKIYPLPSYKDLAHYSYEILLKQNPFVPFSEETLQMLMEQVQANNGYVL